MKSDILLQSDILQQQGNSIKQQTHCKLGFWMKRKKETFLTKRFKPKNHYKDFGWFRFRQTNLVKGFTKHFFSAGENRSRKK
jgi:hypothetical protein